MLRKIEHYIARYGPVAGPKLYRALQSQAAHAGVSARLRRKIEQLSGRSSGPRRALEPALPLFPEVSDGAATSGDGPADVARAGL